MPLTRCQLFSNTCTAQSRIFLAPIQRCTDTFVAIIDKRLKTYLGLVEAIQTIHDVPSDHQITKKLESVILVKVRVLQTHIVSHSLGVPDLRPINVPDFQQIPNLLIHGAPGFVLRVDRQRPVQVILNQFLNLWLKVLILQSLH
jgi:hypothetical protein